LTAGLAAAAAAGGDAGGLVVLAGTGAGTGAGGGLVEQPAPSAARIAMIDRRTFRCQGVRCMP
jgi:hypothetical protein